MRDPPHTPVTTGQPLLLLFEGAHDIAFMAHISAMLARHDAHFPDLSELSRHGKVVILPCGGSPLPWTHRLQPLGCREVHLFDREVGQEAMDRLAAAALVDSRSGCRAFLTRDRSLENYLHPLAIERAGGPRLSFSGEDCVSTCLAKAWHAQQAPSDPWSRLERAARQKKVQRAKRWLNTQAVLAMTPELLHRSDPFEDIKRWLRTIAEMVQQDTALPPRCCRGASH